MAGNDFIEMGGVRIRPGDKAYIRSPDDAERILNYIINELRKYSLDQLLLKVHDYSLEGISWRYNNFSIASFIKFCVLNSTLSGVAPSDEKLFELIDMVTDYELYDPKFDAEFKAHPKKVGTSVFLRLNGQFEWDRDIKFMLSRTLYLFEVLLEEEGAPDYIKYLIKDQFFKINGISLHDLIAIGAVLFSGSVGNKGGLRRDYFETARSQGMPVPDEKIIKKGLRLIACDPTQFKNNKLLIKYGINPLITHPLIRLWENSEENDPFYDKFIAPIPNLVLYRVTIGLYHQLYNTYGEKFATNFGDLFEIYVSKIIGGFNLPGIVIAEKDIDSYLPIMGKKGKKPRRPDWVIFNESGIILIECKATHYTQDTYKKGAEAFHAGWLEQIQKALNQFNEFQKQLPILCRKLGKSYNPKLVRKVIVTFEPLRGLKSGLIRNYVDSKNNSDWVVIPVEDFEEIQPHIAKGYDLWKFISYYKSISDHDFDYLIEIMKDETGATNEDNMFQPYRVKIFDELLRRVVGGNFGIEYNEFSPWNWSI